MNAAGQGKAEILEMLLDAGADINTREKKVLSLSPANDPLSSFSHLFYTLSSDTNIHSLLLIWLIPATLERTHCPNYCHHTWELCCARAAMQIRGGHQYDRQGRMRVLFP